MRRQIVSKLRRAGSALWTAMLFAWIVLLLAIAAIMLGVVLALAVGAYYVFGWWGVVVVAVFMVAVCFGKDRPNDSHHKRKGGLDLNEDPNPWYMQSQYRFHHGPTNNHRGDW